MSTSSSHANSGPSIAVEDVTLLIFGASGDLTARKLMPALFQLRRNGFLSDRSLIIGVARRQKSDDQFREEMRAAVAEHGRNGATESDCWAQFSGQLCYEGIDLTQDGQYSRLREAVEKREQQAGLSGRRIVYLAVAPDLFMPSVEGLADAGMLPEKPHRDRLRVVFEKPFGTDLASAQELSGNLSQLLAEEQIYRIDHYLGKETVQNILLFRFGNAIFEPLLTRTHVDHVQITVAESQGIEGGRGGYYDQSARCGTSCRTTCCNCSA